MSNKINKAVKVLRAMAEVLITFAGFIGALKTFGEAFLLQNKEENEA